MTSNFAQDYADMLAAADRRRGTAPLRAVFGFVIAIVLYIQMGWLWTFGWAAAYAISQGLELAVLRPSRRKAWLEPSRLRAAIIVGVFVLPAVLYAPLAIPIWHHGRYGPFMAVLLLAGGGLNLLVMAGTSAAAFLTPFVIYIGVWITLMLTEQRLSPTGRATAVLLAVIVVANSILAWRIQARALDAARLATEDAERRRQEAQIANDARAAFVALLSHDLRSPIGVVLNGVDRLERGEAVASHAPEIRAAGAAMRDLLADLLDMERMDAGAMPVDPVVFDLRAALADTLRLWRPDALRNGLRLRVTGARELPRFVSGDPTRLRQVVNTLISNALKHTPRGTVAVRLAATPERVTIAVDDTGPGLGSDPERIFAPFDLGPGDPAATPGGLVLALALSRKLARLMGGELSAQNRDGGGSSFLLDLPLAPAEPAFEPVRVSPMRVLIVDDHALNRETLKLLLEVLDVEPVLAESGEEALALLAREPFDLVLMDVHMPGIDGREATRRLRAGGGVNGAVPVIAVSAADSPRDWRQCVEAGMISHVAKPIRAHRLYEAINAALPLRLAA
jgi:signal transduction histidine kinase